MAQDSFEVLDGFPNDVVAVAAHGKIDRQDYQDVLIPMVERVIQSEGRVKLLFVFGQDFHGYSPGAAWDDAKFGFLHMGEFASLAIVTDVEWIRLGVKAFAPFIRCPVVLFGADELELARNWISEWKHDDEGGPGVAADHKIPTLEDKM